MNIFNWKEYVTNQLLNPPLENVLSLRTCQLNELIVVFVLQELVT